MIGLTAEFELENRPESVTLFGEDRPLKPATTSGIIGIKRTCSIKLTTFNSWILAFVSFGEHFFVCSCLSVLLPLCLFYGAFQKYSIKWESRWKKSEDWLIDWLIVLSFMPCRQYASHVTAKTSSRGKLFEWIPTQRQEVYFCCLGRIEKHIHAAR